MRLELLGVALPPDAMASYSNRPAEPRDRLPREEQRRTLQAPRPGYRNIKFFIFS